MAPTLFAVGSVVYFSAFTQLNGYELWKSDGTDAGTAMVLNIMDDGVPSSSPANFTAAGDWVYFDAWEGTAVSTVGPIRSLFRSDGTSAETVKLADAPLPPYLAIGHAALFSVEEGTPVKPLWITDGTPEGPKPATELVSRFPPPTYFLSSIGDTVLVNAAAALWATRLPAGSPAVQICPYGGGDFTQFGNRAMFFVLTGIAVPQTWTLWMTDGTPGGTVFVREIGKEPFYGSVVVNGGFYFVNGSTLWKSDGTFEGTVPVKTLPAPAAGLVATAKHFFFAVVSQLWVSDGTDAGTHSLPITNLDPFAPLTDAAPVGDKLVFS